MAQRDYPAAGLTVHWNSDVCIHSGMCVGALPSVFKPSEKPWIATEGADTEELARAIDGCPSGALSYTRSEASSH